MSVTRFVSDLHLFDPCMYGWRSKTLTVRGYAELLTQNWNSTVSDDDVVIVAGDIGIPCPDTVRVLRGLTGRKILVRGNHDVEWGIQLYTANIFSSIQDWLILDDILVTHVPTTGEGVQSTYRIHGHHHTYEPLSMRSQMESYRRDANRFNCCIDLNGMRPRTLNELMMFKAMLMEDSYL